MKGVLKRDVAYIFGNKQLCARGPVNTLRSIQSEKRYIVNVVKYSISVGK